MCSRMLQHTGSNALPLWKIKHNSNKNQLPTTVNTFSFIGFGLLLTWICCLKILKN